MKSRLLAEYERELRAYPWAEDAAKLANFLAHARDTLNGANLIDRKGPAFQRALKACGLPGKITLDALHRLPA